MNTYTITLVNEAVRTWQTKAGAPWKSYRVTLRNAEGRELPNVELSRSASAPAPKAGEQIEGTVDQSGQYGPKLQEPRKGGAGGSGRSKPPEERRSIAMQHAQKCAVTILEVAASHGAYKPPEKVADMAFHVESVAASLFKQVVMAEQEPTA